MSTSEEQHAGGARIYQPPSENPPSVDEIALKLEQIKQAALDGQFETAYHMSRELVRVAPDNVDGWLYCAALTEDDDQKFAYLSKALSLSPEHARAKRGMYAMMKSYLKQDPFLRYLEESAPMYRIVTGEGKTVIVPKGRADANSAPVVKPFRPVYRWLGYSLLGLPLSGIPTVICASVAWVLAWQAVAQSYGTEQFRRASMTLVYASTLWMIGFLLTFLFILHLDNF